MVLDGGKSKKPQRGRLRGFVIYEMKIQVHYETGRFLKMLYYKEGKSQITVVMVFYYTLGKMHFELQDS